MRTNIVLDDQLVQEAMRLSRIKTKCELVEQALREFVAFRKRLDVRDLKGTGGIREDYDYKSLRGDRIAD
ncbi:MAG: type II toxin-antitoxin system VapB family antitoxin [Methylococcaceae bacterium]|nr:MAG: type II toxin-antitoxin system VapB family antitoxin [Methylococcaceae bacterium]